MLKYTRLILVIVLISIFAFSCIQSINSVKPGYVSNPLEIVEITPTGEDVQPIRQITFQFNRPVVPVGHMDRDASDIPIVIRPKLKGQWRWLNTTTLALVPDEKNTLLPATRYNITVNPGIKAEDGATLKKAIRHSFITALPMVVVTEFKRWESPGTPVMRFMFNMPVTSKSIEKNIYFTYNKEEQIRIKVNAQPDPDEELWLGEELFLDEDFCTWEDLCLDEILWLDENFSDIFQITNHLSFNDRRKEGLRESKYNARHIWLISPVKELPLDTHINFMVEPGLESFGTEKGVEDHIVESIETFPSFKFIGLKCSSLRYKSIMIDLKDDYKKCNPEWRTSLVFSAPVFEDDVIKNIIIEPDFPQGLEFYSHPDQMYIDLMYESSHSRGDTYSVLLPDIFNANKDYRIVNKLGEIHDAFGRPLEEPIDISFCTDQLEPAYNYNNSPVVLEKDMNTDMFFSVRKIDSLKLFYERLTTKGIERSLTNPIPLPESKDTETVVPAEIRKMLKGKSGLVNGTVNITPDIDYPYNPQLFIAQVTPFHVHAKVGQFNTLVWVTEMSTGNPVSDAKVKIYRDLYSSPDTDPTVLSSGKTDLSGVAILGGENIMPKQSQ